jgi:chromate reductase, NAD(P)H dehydrogenase (quinone)
VTPPEKFRVLGIPGSLRQASYNRGLIRAAQQVAPDGVEVSVFDLLPIPLFNEDVEAQGDPEPVRAFKEQIRAADALLIAAPEYNYSIPGVLKNAIDWASRPPNDSPLRHKPIALMGASPGGFGTVRSQIALRQVFLFTKSFVLPEPELYVSAAHEKFDRDGNLDEQTRQRIRAVLEALVTWSRRFGSDS